MREILFRGKRMDNGKWVEGAFCPKNCDDPFGPMVDRPSIIKLSEPCDGFWFDVDPATVGQYIGLTDKNGKKIFEGDIWDCKGCVGVIGWVEETCTFEAAYKMNGIECSNAVTDVRAKTVEVIGNIHDNPELIADA